MNSHLFHKALPSIVALALVAACSERPASIPQPTAETAPASGAAGPVAPTFSIANDAAASLALAQSGTCSLENVLNMSAGTPSPGDQPNSYRADRRTPYKLIGFATNSDEGTVPSSLHVLLHGAGGDFAMAAAAGLDRDDVAKYFKKPGLAKSGYQVDATFSGMAPGSYEVFIVKAEGAAARLCPTHQIIVLD